MRSLLQSLQKQKWQPEFKKFDQTNCLKECKKFSFCIFIKQRQYIQVPILSVIPTGSEIGPTSSIFVFGFPALSKNLNVTQRRSRYEYTGIIFLSWF